MIVFSVVTNDNYRLRVTLGIIFMTVSPYFYTKPRKSGTGTDMERLFAQLCKAPSLDLFPPAQLCMNNMCITRVYFKGNAPLGNQEGSTHCAQ